MALTEATKKYWQPDPKVINWLTSKRIAETDKVLEIGPGTVPFRRSNVYVDFVDVGGLEPEKPFFRIDVATSKLPFDDKSFDFVYCRHTLEDVWNPFSLCDEMSRVGKAGYIECPSPAAELCRGIDGSSPPFRGYHHHRWIIWSANRQLRITPKYPIIEYMNFNEGEIEELLKTARYWNSCYLWSERINYQHRQSPFDYTISTDYALMLADAMMAAKGSTDEFYFPVNAGNIKELSA